MDGYLIKYEAKDDYGRTLVNHTLFGRIVYRNYRGRKYGYYIPGFLDKKPYYKEKVSELFVKDLDDIDVDLLQNYADITITKVDVPEVPLTTGREHWTNKAKSKGVIMRVRRKTKNKEQSEHSQSS